MNMLNDPRKSQESSPIAAALRAAGFVPLPRLWVRGDDIPLVHQITDRYKDEINDIRHRTRNALPESVWIDNQPVDVLIPEPVSDGGPKADPKLDKDAAWAAFEKLRGG